VAAAAREALVSHRRDPAVKPLPERLRRALLSGVGERPLLAARALGALRDVESIPILIQALESGSPETMEAAADALAQITLQRHGPNPQRWLRWWKENRGRSRAEWLFAALTAPDRELRLAASGELRSAAEPPVRYSVDLPAAELEAASRSWWVWWSRQSIAL
jgi:HEAT repeat protein